jgi:hypothetical protein
MYKTAKEQIVRGLQLGGSLGLFLIAAMLMGDGWSRVFDTANIHQIFGWTEIGAGRSNSLFYRSRMIPITWRDCTGGNFQESLHGYDWEKSVSNTPPHGQSPPRGNGVLSLLCGDSASYVSVSEKEADDF